MRVQPVAQVYAEALLSLARQREQIEAVGTELGELAALVASHPEVANFLETPVLEPEVQKQALEQALGGRVQRLLVDFLSLLIDKGRIGALAAIAIAYRDLADQEAGRTRVQAATAKPLQAESAEKLVTLLQARLQRQCILETKVQPELLGGLVLSIGDTIYDGSLRGRLQRLRHAMMRSSGYEN
ncbi:MAG TPA: ATP synthase F1 subunit delta [Candidatus Krumholzibacteria bacterium]|nr:ATP synthase F1 subunit delta [Candidatus Krumholzibacteria bacterium]